MADIFTDAFESGDFSNWYNTVTSGDGTLTVNGSYAYSGSYGARIYSVGTGGQNERADIRKDITFPASGKLEVEFRCKLLSDGGSGGELIFKALHKESPIWNHVLGVFNSYGTWSLWLRKRDDTGSVTDTFTPPTDNAWHLWRYEYDQSGSTVIVRLYIDNTLVANVEDSSTGTDWSPDFTVIGMQETSWTTGTFEAHIDVVAVRDALSSESSLSLVLSTITNASTLFGLTVSNSGANNLRHGQSFVLPGSGFGTKSTAAPWAWDDFTGLSLGNGDFAGNTTPVGSRTWVQSDPGDRATCSFYGIAEEGRRSGKKCYKKVSSGDNFAGPHLTGIASPEVYLSFWQKWSAPGSVNTGGSVLKYFRFTANTLYDGVPSLLCSSQPMISDSRHAWIEGLNSSGSQYLSPQYCALVPVGQSQQSNWVRIEGHVKLSTAGVSDGLASLRSQTAYTSLTGLAQRLTGNASVIDYVMIETTPANNIAYTHSWWIDEVYLDTTRKRVELGDASTWSACTKREIQRATAWSDTEITIVGNHGAFAADTTAYLYVIDENGDPISTNGFEVFLEGTSSPTFSLFLFRRR